MKKLFFLLIGLVALSCSAQETFGQKSTEDFYGETKKEQIRTRVICYGESFGDSIVFYEKGRKPKTYIIIGNVTRDGDKDNCVNLISNVYGYDVSYPCITKDEWDKISTSNDPKDPDIGYIITYRTITLQYTCSFLRKLWFIDRIKIKTGTSLDKVIYDN